jgi:hypothetical protein
MMNNKNFSSIDEHHSFLAKPNSTRPVWKDQNMSCTSCTFNDQDIDTFPCAKCHTRMQ